MSNLRAETTPDEEDRGTEVALVLTDHLRRKNPTLSILALEGKHPDKTHVGGDDRDDGVPEPVGRGRESNSAGSDGNWKKSILDQQLATF